MLDRALITNIEEKIFVEDDPFPNCVIEDLLPKEIAIKAEEEFTDFNGTGDSGNARYQLTKRHTENYKKMPLTIKKIIDFLYSKDFIDILEKKFKLKNVQPDWNLHGGGMHESFKGGFLKIHSDFLYMRKSKFKRVLNILLYLNSDWNKEWGGSIEFWDKKMTKLKKSIAPDINKAVIFRTDKESNHGFPEPLTCPENVKRKSIALYYYIEDKTLLPIVIKRRKHFHAVWKKRPNIDEPVFADQDNFFKRLKHKYFYRFF